MNNNIPISEKTKARVFGYGRCYFCNQVCKLNDLEKISYCDDASKDDCPDVVYICDSCKFNLDHNRLYNIPFIGNYKEV